LVPAPLNIPRLVNAISSDRFTSYLNARGQDQDRAFALYEWNAELCGAFYMPLQAVEVALRNSFHRELQASFGIDWPLEPKFLGVDIGLHKTIDDAKQQVRASKCQLDTPHVVAALSFGFWTTLLSKRLTDAIWLPALHRAFPEFYKLHAKAVTRADAAKLFDEIRHFRNRVFHHEPLFHRKSLQGDYDRLLEAAAWICPDLTLWARQRSASCQTMITLGPPP